MKIALDYDGTYTLDQPFWRGFIENAFLRGHDVHLVTMRYPAEAVDGWLSSTLGPERVHYTGHEFKQPHMAKKGHAFDIWIDDSPAMVTGPNGVLHWE